MNKMRRGPSRLQGKEADACAEEHKTTAARRANGRDSGAELSIAAIDRRLCSPQQGVGKKEEPSRSYPRSGSGEQKSLAQSENRVQP